jgi:hypothetical protein
MREFCHISILLLLLSLCCFATIAEIYCYNIFIYISGEICFATIAQLFFCSWVVFDKVSFATFFASKSPARYSMRFPASSLCVLDEHFFWYNRVGFVPNKIFFATLVRYGSKSGIS